MNEGAGGVDAGIARFLVYFYVFLGFSNSPPLLAGKRRLHQASVSS